MKKRTIISIILSFSLVLAIFSGCSGGGASSSPAPTTGVTPTPSAQPSAEVSPTPPPSAPGDGGGTIALNGSSLSFEGAGAEINGSAITISAAGTYTVSGTLEDGQIIVEAGKDDKVVLILSGAHISCSDSAPIWVKSADKVTLYLTENTENSVADGASYTQSADGEPNAAIYSKDDLTIEGGGSLSVTASFNNGIQSSNDIRIKSGSVSVTAANHGIKGKDSVRIGGGVISIVSGGDGLKSDNADEDGRGYIYITGGSVTIDADEDGLQADNYILVEGGTIDVTAGEDGFNASNDITVTDGSVTVNSQQDAFDSDGTLNVKNGSFTILSAGGSANSSSSGQTGFWGGGFGGRPGFQPPSASSGADEVSAKGLKADAAVTIDGGVFSFDTADDAIHSNGDVTINGGVLTISSGDDGVHADSSLTINGGTLDILKSYEGIESSKIYLNGGVGSITASDDGINAAGGSDGSSISGRPGMGGFSQSTGSMEITGGVWTVSAAGDGLDANGNISMSGGQVTVYGPTSSGNGALDYDGSFVLTGGTLYAAGAYGMAQSPSASSGQCSLNIVFFSGIRAGQAVSIRDSSGGELASFSSPAKSWQSLVVSVPGLKAGGSYTVWLDGTQAVGFTQTSTTTSVSVRG